MARWSSRLSPFLATGIAVFAKASKIMVLASSLTMAQVLFSAFTLMLSTLAYSLMTGITAAILLMLMLLIHEMGHVMAMRHKGMPTALPVFIPFIGAVISSNLSILDRDGEAFVAYAGPFIGSCAAYVCLVAWWIIGSPVLLFGAWIGIMINLFNMIPLRPLDGGRILQIVSPSVKYYGLAILMIVTLLMREPGYLVIWVLVLPSMDLPIWWRSGTAIGITLAMIGMIMLGFGDEPFATVVVDIVVAVGLASVCTYADWSRAKLIAKYGPQVQFGLDDRPYPAAEVRIFWLAAYVMTVVLLGGTLWGLTLMIANGA